MYGSFHRSVKKERVKRDKSSISIEFLIETSLEFSYYTIRCNYTFIYSMRFIV